MFWVRARSINPARASRDFSRFCRRPRKSKPGDKKTTCTGDGAGACVNHFVRLTMSTDPQNSRMAGWEATRRCNLTCPHCYTAATRKQLNELTTDESLRIVDQLADLGITTIGWTGGEPLLRDDLEEIASHASWRGITRQGITTNGILLTEARARSLQTAGVNYIQISVDGSTAERNQAIRRATLEDFDTILEAVRICKRIDLHIDLAMVLGRATLDDAVPYLELAFREGIGRVRFCGFVPTGRGKRKDVISRLLFDEDLGALRAFVDDAVCLESPIAMFDPAFGPTPPSWEFHECIAGKTMIYINCIGDVYPCTSLLDDRFKVGNLRERTLADLMADPKMTEMSNFPKDQIHGHCRECDSFDVCRGACRGITYAHTRDLYASFPLCLKRADKGDYPSGFEHLKVTDDTV